MGTWPGRGVRPEKSRTMSIRHDGGKQLVEPVRPPLEIQPAEQRLQGGGGLVLLPAGGPGDGVGRGIPSPAEHAALLLVQQREDACGGGQPGRGRAHTAQWPGAGLGPWPCRGDRVRSGPLPQTRCLPDGPAPGWTGRAGGPGAYPSENNLSYSAPTLK